MERRIERVLSWWFRVEAAIACGALALVIAALLADVVARELLGSGLFGAQRFAVYSNLIGSLLGFAIVVHTGGHLRLAVMDRVFPSAWERAIQRAADGVSAALCLLLGYFAFRFVSSTFVLGDTDAVFQMRIWPLQALMAYIFLSAAARYVLYAAFPALRPQERGAADQA